MLGGSREEEPVTHWQVPKGAAGREIQIQGEMAGGGRVAWEYENKIIHLNTSFSEKDYKSYALQHIWQHTNLLKMLEV